MKENKLLTNILPVVEPPVRLKKAVFKRIEGIKERRLKAKLLLTDIGFVGSFLASFWAILTFGDAFLQSEFWSIVSLIFSDFMVVAGSWKEYLFSLGETLPIMNIVAIIIPVFGTLMFLNLLLFFKKKYRYSHNHFNLYKNNLVV
jgi:hypothetical protein